MIQLNENIQNEEEFLGIINKNKGIITKICYFYSNNPDEFKDLRQDVLAAVWYSFKSFRGVSDISTWIYRITLNTCLSSLRKHKRGGIKVGLDFIRELENEESNTFERCTLLYRLINDLKNDDKAIILLWLDELPYEEIASIMGIPRNTIASRIRRIKHQLSVIAQKEL